MRKALGSIPSGSICSCTALVGVFFLRLTEQHKDIRTSTRLVPVTRRTSKDSPSEASSSPNTPGEEDWSHSNWPAFVPRASVCQGRSGRLGCSGRSGVFPRRTLRQRILRCFSSKHLIRFEAFYPKQPKDRRTSTHLWVYSGLPPRPTSTAPVGVCQGLLPKQGGGLTKKGGWQNREGVTKQGGWNTGRG